MVKIAVGMMGGSPAGSSSLATASQISSYLDVVASHNVTELDTARNYANGESEAILGQIGASSRFTISTKAPGFVPGILTAEKIAAASAASHEALQQEQVDIYYIHGPDRQTPLEEQAKAFNELHKQGRFKRFGVCNMTEEEVQEVWDICKREGYVLPTVYQGWYNILQRNVEDSLFPLLRKLGMNFYGFGPLAHGLLAKNLEDIKNPAKGSHFAEMPALAGMYLKEKSLAALEEFGRACEAEGLSKMAVALRWELHHSPLVEEDAVLVGAGSKEHIEKSLTAAEGGPLSEDLVKAVQKLWDAVKDEAVPNHL